MFAAEITGLELLGISEEEVSRFAIVLARVMSANRKKAEKVEAELSKRGPWANFAIVAAAIYGPRLVMLWNIWKSERARRNRKPAVVVIREEPEQAPAVEPTSKVVQ